MAGCTLERWRTQRQAVYEAGCLDSPSLMVLEACRIPEEPLAFILH